MSPDEFWGFRVLDPDTDGKSFKGSSHSVVDSVVAEGAMGLALTQDGSFWEEGLGHRGWSLSSRGFVDGPGSLHSQCLVRSDPVVEIAKLIEFSLDVGLLFKEDLSFDGSVKAFDFPLGLGMVGSAVRRLDTKEHQPEIESAPAPGGIAFERSAVVREHLSGKPKLCESLPKHAPGRLQGLVGNYLQGDAEASAIVQNRQRVFPGSVMPKTLVVGLP